VRVAAQQQATGPAALGRPAPAVAVNNAVAGPHLSTKDVGNSTNIRWHESMVARRDKEMLLGQRGCVLWFTGGCQLLRGMSCGPFKPAATACSSST
jgi:adenylylsulfate kinase